MNKKAFAKAIQGINYGDNVRLCVRGIYNDYSHEGILQKIERGFVFLKRGQAHSYRKLVGIKKIGEVADKKVDSS